VPDRDERADDGDRGGVASNSEVAPDRGKAEDHDERVHRDALVPAQHARREARDLGEVQAADRGRQRDAEGEPQRSRRDERSHAIHQAGQQARPIHGDERQGQEHAERGHQHEDGQEGRNDEHAHACAG
jgi:hypothetical protein